MYKKKEEDTIDHKSTQLIQYPYYRGLALQDHFEVKKIGIDVQEKGNDNLCAFWVYNDG